MTNQLSRGQIDWMYEGIKSLVNREDYLLGKRLDKNFENYSDVLNKDEDETGIDSVVQNRLSSNVAPSSSSSANVDIDIIRNEDPLVAIKVQQETLRQERIENPLVMLKMKRMARKAMEKKIEKLMKRQMKAKGMETSEAMQKMKNILQDVINKKANKEFKNSSKRSRRCSSSSSRESERRSSRNSGSRSKKSEGFTSRRHEPRRSRSHSREVKRSRGSRHELWKPRSASRTHYHEQRTHNAEKYVKEKNRDRSKLVDEEIERRRQEMLNNVEWRNSTRETNLKVAAIRDKLEERDDQGNAVDFIRPMLNSATSSLTVEKRLSSQRQHLLKSHEFMDKL